MRQIRIIGGTLRGSKLDVPDVPGLRPTPDRARETLFNWLMPVLPGARVLDLFAGTGALGIEAMSRGASACTFVESESAVVMAIRASLARLKQDAVVVHGGAAGALSRLPGPFDLVFVDPPFADDLWTTTLALLEQGGQLAPAAWIHVEAPVGATFEVPPRWSLWREGRFGDVMIRLYRRTADSTIS